LIPFFLFLKPKPVIANPEALLVIANEARQSRKIHGHVAALFVMTVGFEAPCDDDNLDITNS